MRRLEQQQRDTGDALAWYRMIDTKIEKEIAKLGLLHYRMEVLEEFTQKSVPLMTHL